jgi:hypothetical protein
MASVAFASIPSRRNLVMFVLSWFEIIFLTLICIILVVVVSSVIYATLGKPLLGRGSRQMGNPD